MTGRGADIIVIDDPLKPEEALSQAQRKAANEWFDHTLYSRPWEVLSFPAIAEADEVHAIETIWGPQCFTPPSG